MVAKCGSLGCFSWLFTVVMFAITMNKGISGVCICKTSYNVKSVFMFLDFPNLECAVVLGKTWMIADHVGLRLCH